MRHGRVAPLKNSFTFVHAADLHLDSPFRGVSILDPSIVNTLRDSTFNAYRSLIDLCIERQAAFLLVAGDVYDAEDRSLRAQLRFRDGLVRLAEKGIRAFVVHGNHDHCGTAASAIRWPENVHIFDHHKMESRVVTVNGAPAAVVYGLSHGRKSESENLAKRFRPSDMVLFGIGLLHCNVGANTGHEPYAPCELSDLLDVRLDYWALGHVHERRSLCGAPHVLYPGNIQGRHFREAGERGCFLVTVEGTEVANVEFCPLDSVRWLEASVDIGGIATIDELDRSVMETIQGLVRKSEGRAIVCRLNVEGRGSLYQELRKSNNVADLLDRVREAFEGEDPFVWVHELIIDCRPEIDVERRREAGDFLAQVLSVSAEIERSPEGAREFSRRALSCLLSNRQIEKTIGGFSEGELARMSREAELICLDSFESGE
jgi:DNA repair protein SbcD/Mre11